MSNDSGTYPGVFYFGGFNMDGFGKSFLKFMLAGLVWVYVLSIPINGQAIFFPIRSVLVQNQAVAALDKEVREGLSKLKIMAQRSLREESSETYRRI